jgi:hypothetical protein
VSLYERRLLYEGKPNSRSIMKRAAPVATMAADSELRVSFSLSNIVNLLRRLKAAGPSTSLSSLHVLATLRSWFDAADDAVFNARDPGPHSGCLDMNWRIRSAISSVFSSSAKCPASSKWISAFGRSRLKASAPGAMKEGSCSPQTTRVGG